MKGFARMLNSTHLSSNSRAAVSAAVEHFPRNCWLDDAASLHHKKPKERERGEKIKGNSISFAERQSSCVGALFPSCLPRAVSQPGITTLNKHDYQLILQRSPRACADDTHYQRRSGRCAGCSHTTAPRWLRYARLQ